MICRGCRLALFLIIAHSVIVYGVTVHGKVSESSSILNALQRYDQYLELKNHLPAPLVSDNLRDYAAGYHQQLNSLNIERPMGAGELLAAVQKSAIVLVGDVHDNPLDKIHFNEILQAMSHKTSSLYVVLEWVPREFSPALRQYLDGGLTLRQFARVLRESHFWPFPLAPYLDTLKKIKELGVQILLPEFLNGTRNVWQRDQAVVERIHAARALDSRARFLVFYGNYHLLGGGHLLDLLHQGGLGNPLVVLGYAENLYWQGALFWGQEKLGEAFWLGANLVYWSSADPLVWLEERWQQMEAERRRWEEDLALLE